MVQNHSRTYCKCYISRTWRGYQPWKSVPVWAITKSHMLLGGWEGGGPGSGLESMRGDLSPTRSIHWKGVGQCAEVRMLPEGLAAENRNGAAESPTSQGLELGMTWLWYFPRGHRASRAPKWGWEYIPFPHGSAQENLPAMQEMEVWSLGWEDSLEKGLATHSSILAWEIPWIEEPVGLQSLGSKSQTLLNS